MAVNRRQFLGQVASASALAAGKGKARRVALVADSSDPVVAAPSVLWAVKELRSALEPHGVAVIECKQVGAAAKGDLCIVAAGRGLQANGVADADGFTIAPKRLEQRHALVVSGNDARGLVYGLLELADEVRCSEDPVAALESVKTSEERPANPVRSMMRLFTSESEDKPWFYDREMWPEYFTMLATQRFNRFNLALGIGYDFIRQVTDAYFLFAYPFLVAVPGYKVRVPQLANAERERNLEMLRFISEQAAARGLHFQLGLWTHGYRWIDSPQANYTIEGLDRETHGPYCRDALKMLLRECPAINGVTFRVHGESGVEEGSYDFWKTVFSSIAGCGRTVEIDMHPKGMTEEMLDIGIATGQPLRVSPKFWAEHMGMPYHQADIREEERPKQGKDGGTLMKFSAGSRSFLRYGYGDLLREDRKWKVTHRIWPGTQRLLLWGDPLSAAAYSRAFGFCGSDGVEICEPLSFKGRRGSGLAPGNRCAYADATLRPRWDWQKYLYGTRIWGRHLYNPDCDAGVWERYLNRTWGAGGKAAGAALAQASRILPAVTTAYGPSAANNSYWPEMYWNQSLVDAAHPAPYTDTLAPKVFGNASAFDPQLFLSMNECAAELLSGEHSGKYSPIEVAQWLEDWATEAQRQLAEARGAARERESPEFRRLALDVAIQAGLGEFFGAKFRSGVLYRLFETTGDVAAHEACCAQYRRARAAWVTLAERARGPYLPDVTVGEQPHLRGHWADRLTAIEKDIQAVEAKRSTAKQDSLSTTVTAAIRAALGRPERAALACSHTAPANFQRGQALEVSLTAPRQAAVRIYYRHVDQAERFQSAEMALRGDRYVATIAREYTDSDFPLQYYFEVRQTAGAGFYPRLQRNLSHVQPYFVVRRG
jgi:hypothetical protein